VAARWRRSGRLFALFFAALGDSLGLLRRHRGSRLPRAGGFIGLSIAQLVATLTGTLTTFCAVIAVQCAMI
jgi:hypothetical protein